MTPRGQLVCRACGVTGRTSGLPCPRCGSTEVDEFPIAERGAPDRTYRADRRAAPCEGQAEFSRSGEAAEKVSAVSASDQEHRGQSDRTAQGADL